MMTLSVRQIFSYWRPGTVSNPDCSSSKSLNKYHHHHPDSGLVSKSHHFILKNCLKNHCVTLIITDFVLVSVTKTSLNRDTNLSSTEGSFSTMKTWRSTQVKTMEEVQSLH